MGAPLGNQNTRKGKAWTEALKRALARYSGESVDKGLDRLADRMVKAAIEGDDDQAAVMIAEKIGDRIEGKPTQAVGLEDGNGGPVSLAVSFRGT